MMRGGYGSAASPTTAGASPEGASASAAGFFPAPAIPAIIPAAATAASIHTAHPKARRRHPFCARAGLPSTMIVFWMMGAPFAPVGGCMEVAFMRRSLLPSPAPCKGVLKQSENF